MLNRISYNKDYLNFNPDYKFTLDFKALCLAALKLKHDLEVG